MLNALKFTPLCWVALLGNIRRGHIRDQIPLWEVGISRNIVRHYLHSESHRASLSRATYNQCFR